MRIDHSLIPCGSLTPASRVARGKTETKFDDLLLELLHGPVKAIAFVIFLFICLDLFDWPPLLEGILDKGFRIIFALAVTYTALKAVDMLMNYWKERSSGTEDVHLDAHLFPIVSKSLKFLLCHSLRAVVLALLPTSGGFLMRVNRSRSAE